MTSNGRKMWKVGRGAVVCAVMMASCGRMPAQAVQVAEPGTGPVTVKSESDAAALQEQLITLVKLSPTLERVVQRDPSLLSDAAYVEKNNPELEQFLVAHPDVTRNPDFYLFSSFRDAKGENHDGLERKGPGQDAGRPHDSGMEFVERAVIPFVIFLCVSGAILWMVQLFVMNRRWNRTSKLQMEAHGKLMDRFGNNQELLTYMGSEAGRRFLEAAPLALDAESGQKMPNAVSRVLLSVQIGAVLTLLGSGLLLLSRMILEQQQPLMVTGVVFLMPGLGFLISAVITWLLANRLGLLPVAGDKGTGHNGEQR